MISARQTPEAAANWLLSDALHRGVLLRKDKRHRLVISVHLIQQAASVEIDAGDVVSV